MVRAAALWVSLAVTGCVELVGRAVPADGGDAGDARVDVADAAGDRVDAPVVVPQDVPPIPGCARTSKGRSGQEITPRGASLMLPMTVGFHVKSAVLDGQGGVVVFGGSTSCGRAGTFDAFALRIGADGALDSAFGVGGRLCLDTASSGESVDESFVAATVDARGRIVLVGFAESRSTLYVRGIVARITPEGAFDRSFFGQGWRNLAAAQSVTQAPNLALWGVVTDGARIVAVGSDASPFRLPTLGVMAALDDTGALDTGFHRDGLLFDNARNFRDVALRSDGYLVAGTERAEARVSLRMIDRRGDPVPGFGDAGVAVHALPQDALAGDLLVDDNGGAYLVRGVVPPGATINTALASVVHFLPDGRSDMAFGVNGAYETGDVFNYSYQHGHHLARHCGGTLLYAGQGPGGAPPIRVHRFTTLGLPDATFGSEGVATLRGSGRPGVIAGAASVHVLPASAEVVVTSGVSANDAVYTRVATP